jgi:hypothetical protein
MLSSVHKGPAAKFQPHREAGRDVRFSGTPVLAKPFRSATLEQALLAAFTAPSN